MLDISIATASFWSMWSKVDPESMREEGINPNRGNHRAQRIDIFTAIANTYLPACKHEKYMQS